MAEPPRLTSRMLVDVLIRRVQAAGGFAAILHRGNDSAGTIVLICSDRGQAIDILEKTTDLDGRVSWRAVGEPHAASANWMVEYGEKRVRGDPDLWLVELDIAGAARFADEVIAFD
jgi:hypothetical protein